MSNIDQGAVESLEISIFVAIGMRVNASLFMPSSLSLRTI